MMLVVVVCMIWRVWTSTQTSEFGSLWFVCMLEPCLVHSLTYVLYLLLHHNHHSENNVCHCDGKQSMYEINIFSSYNACCQFSLLTDKSKCNQFKTLQESKCVRPSDITQNTSPSSPSAPTGPSAPSPPTPSSVGGPSSDACAGKKTLRQCTKASECIFDRDIDRCVERNDPKTPLSGGDSCSGLSKRQCSKASHCIYDEDVDDCALRADATMTTKNDSLTSSGAVFYPNPFHKVCLNDGQQTVAVQTYTSVTDCCRDPWVEWKTCIRHANGNRPVAGVGGAGVLIRGDNSGSVNDSEGGHKYYPDYFYNLCRNDGKQSSMVAKLFDKLEDCCNAEHILDYDGCMSSAGS